MDDFPAPLGPEIATRWWGSIVKWIGSNNRFSYPNWRSSTLKVAYGETLGYSSSKNRYIRYLLIVFFLADLGLHPIHDCFGSFHRPCSISTHCSFIHSSRFSIDESDLFLCFISFSGTRPFGFSAAVFFSLLTSFFNFSFWAISNSSRSFSVLHR